MASLQAAMFYGKPMRIQYAKEDSKVIVEAKGTNRLSKVIGSKDKVKLGSKKPMACLKQPETDCLKQSLKPYNCR
uniref:Uncharacterized protein n=1 Tax=Ditylenchus dipsaci TaxID=166011 RepID=A0A915CZH1_9BILA